MTEDLCQMFAGALLTLVGFAHIKQDYRGISTSVATAVGIAVTTFAGIHILYGMSVILDEAITAVLRTL